MRNDVRLFFALALFLLVIVSSATAQTDRAALEGTVTDSTGAVLTDAKVSITAIATGEVQARSTDQHGHYLFPGVAIGDYNVVVMRDGMETQQVQDVELQVGQTRTLDIAMKVGTVAETVVVHAPDTATDRSTAASAAVIRDDQIDNLPINGRDWAGLTLLAPFAQDDGGGDQRTIRFAGRARDDNNFSIDGVDAGGIQEQAQKSQTRLQISEDAIAEYRVNSALYDAEYGTQAGGQINVVTKSGTNDFHGTAFGYLRNSVFDARNFNDGPSVAPFRMGQYGMSFGGPVIKDNTFFFLDYEGLRQYQGSTFTAAVPTPQFLNEVLTTGDGNGSGPSPQMCPILQSYPWSKSTGTVGSCAPRFVFDDSMFSAIPGGPTIQDGSTTIPTAQNFTHVAATTVHEDTWLVRLDHKISDRTTVYGRAQRDISLVDGPNGNSLDQLRTINHPANYFIALQHVFTSNLANEAKVYVNRAPFHNPQASVLPYAVATPDFEPINNNSADIEVGTTYGIVDNLTLTHGRNTFKMGGEIRRVRLNQGQTANNSLDFGSDDTNLLTATLNQVTSIAPWCCHKLRRTFYMPYFEDELKITPTFTANLGLRWEYYGVANEADNSTTVFDLTQFHGVCLGSHTRNVPLPNPPINTQPCPVDPQLYNPDYRNFDPRVSFAWAPGMLHGNTVFRTGFGIYHGAAQNDDLNAGLESDTFRASIPNTPLIPLYEQASPDLSGVGGGAAANHPRALQREDRRDLYVEEWGFTIDHALPSNFMLTAAYMGSHGVRLFSRGAVNLCTTNPDINGNCVRYLDQFYPLDPSVGPSPTNPNSSDPFGSVDYKSDIGSSSYNALNLSLERRFQNGLSFQTRYTYSHSINDGSVGGGESTGPENVNCLQCDNGPSIYDIRHNITADAVYELPFGPGKQLLRGDGLLGRVFGGWSLTGIGGYHTGHPLTVSMNISPAQLPDGNDQTNQRPDIIPGVPLYMPDGGHNGIPLINAAAFAPPPLNPSPNVYAGQVARFGDEPNGIIRALPSWQVDLELLKEEKITERVAFQFGFQAFNILNHTQLGDPHDLTLNYVPNPSSTGPAYILQPASDFGVINTTVNFNNNNDNAASPNTGTGLPRQLQFMARVRF